MSRLAIFLSALALCLGAAKASKAMDVSACLFLSLEYP